MFRLQLALLVSLGLLAGCGEVIVFGHTVREGSSSAHAKTDASPVAQGGASQAVGETTTSPAVRIVKAVTLSLSPQASTRVAGDARFNADALREAINNELRARKLLDEREASDRPVAHISIDEFDVHPTTNAIVFGYIPSAGTLKGDVRVSDTGGDEQTFRVEADSRFSIAEKGEDNPLKPLYRRFANLVADRLDGTPPKSDSTDE